MLASAGEDPWSRRFVNSSGAQFGEFGASRRRLGTLHADFTIEFLEN